MDELYRKLLSYRPISPFIEPIIERTYRLLLKPGDVVLDGGAHGGRHTIPLAEVVGSSGRVLAFEPQPTLCGHLQHDLRGRGLNHVELHNLALSKTAGRMPFFQVVNNSAYSGFAKRDKYGFEAEFAEFEVEAVTIDSIYAHEDRRLRFMKLDVEGAEFDALLGAAETLERHQPLVIFESGRQADADRFGYTKETFFGLFERIGYEIRDLYGRAFQITDWGNAEIPWYFLASGKGSHDSSYFSGRYPSDVAAFLERAGAERR